jgi:hypothetical protein
MMTHEEDAVGFDLFIRYTLQANMVRQLCDLKYEKPSCMALRTALTLSRYSFCTLKKQGALYQSGITRK